MFYSNYKIFNNKNIFITGGTGSFGSFFIKSLLKKSKPKKIICYSRDELKQFNFQNDLKKLDKRSCIRFFIGDVRDQNRLDLALLNNKIDFLFHAAALKQVPAVEYNPFEAVKTNILGAQNVIEASIKNNVRKIIALSTDKASSPLNFYGATKLVSDKIFINANAYSKKSSIFSVVRYGNVSNSRGSVIPIFNEINRKNEKFLVTHKEMTRFNISLEDATNFTANSIKEMIGGEIFVPKIPSYNIVDLVKAFKKNPNIKIIGLRPGEKLHEEMISIHDSTNTLEAKDHFIILPNVDFFDYNLNSYIRKKNKIKYKKLEKRFSYNSQENKNFLSINQLKKIIANTFKK
jgi:UDP-N-acetylglucosamine 4,6-dehydratase